MKQNIKQTTSDATCKLQVEILSRRAVLRGAIIAGCCVIVPIGLLVACSKGAESTAPALARKQSKAEVKYQSQPNGEQKCSSCMNFNSAKNTCQRVEGPVSPDGWCVLWARNA